MKHSVSNPGSAELLESIYDEATSVDEKTVVLESLVMMDHAEDLALKIVRTESDAGLRGQAIQVLHGPADRAREARGGGGGVAVGEGLFANHATLLFNRQGVDETVTGKVGSEGEFTWWLAPGEYHVSAVTFSNRGERIEPALSLNFTVHPEVKAVYIGTVTIDSSFDSGYYGTDARLDSTTVRNECRADCAARLEALGLDKGDMSVSILHRPGHVASNY